MQQALNLTEQERLCFMQALNAVAYLRGKPEEVWLTLLRQVGGLLEVSKADYQFQAGVPGIAEKVNQITNPRARLYFLRIIHDVHLKEVQSRIWPLGGGGTDATFRRFYSQLAAVIRLD